jgi:hypothetical protein
LASYLRAKELSLISELRSGARSPDINKWHRAVEIVPPQLALMQDILTKVEQLERGERPARLTPSQEEP